MRSNRRERLRQLREKIKAHREPLVIERVFRSAPNASAVSAVHLTADRATAADAGTQASSTADGLRRRCPACDAVADLDARFCSKCGVRLVQS